MFDDPITKDDLSELDVGDKQDQHQPDPYQDELATERAAAAQGKSRGSPGPATKTEDRLAAVKKADSSDSGNNDHEVKIDSHDSLSEAVNKPPEEIVFDSNHPQFQKLESGKVYRASMQDQGKLRQVIIYIPTTYTGRTTAIAGMDGLALKQFNSKAWLANKWDVLAEKTGAALIVPENLAFYDKSHPLYILLKTHLVDWGYGQEKRIKSPINRQDPFASFFAPGQRSVTKSHKGPNDTIFMRNLLEHVRENTNIFIGARGARFVSFSSGGTMPRAMLKNPEISNWVDSMVNICSTDYLPNKASPITRSIEDLRPGEKNIPELVFFGNQDQLVPPAGGDGPKTKPLRPFGHTNLAKYSEPRTIVVMRALSNGGTGIYEVVDQQSGYEIRQYQTRPEAPVVQVDVIKGRHRVFDRRQIESGYSHNSPKVEGEPDVTSITLAFWHDIDRARFNSALRAAVNTDNVQELTKLACSAENYSDAALTVGSILTLHPDNLPQILRAIADSHSAATFSAMCHLMKHSRDPADQTIILDSIKNGKMAQLFQAGYLNPLDLFASALPGITDKSAADDFMKALDPYPELKIKFCQTLPKYFSSDEIGDHPQSFEHLSVSALEYLIEKKPAKYERVLNAYALSDGTNVKSTQMAREYLLAKWTNQKQSTDGQPAVNPLLLNKNLQQFDHQLGDKPWVDGLDPQATYEGWVKASRKARNEREASANAIVDHIFERQGYSVIDDLGVLETFTEQSWQNSTIMEPLLQDSPTLLAKYRTIRGLEQKADEIRQSMEWIIKKRLDRVVDSAQAITGKLGLRCPKIVAIPDTELSDPDDPKSSELSEHGSYTPGQISIREGLLMQGTHPVDELKGTIGHELGHDYDSELMLCRVIDLLEEKEREKVTLQAQ